MFSEEKFVPIKTYLKEEFQFFAHKRELEGERLKEELQNHITLCEKYFLKINDAKNLANAFEMIYQIWFKDTSESCREVYYEMVQNVISFHDFGKFNPQFQKKKMDHIIDNDSEQFIGNDLYTNHSMLSAILYLDYYRDKVLLFPMDEKKPLRYFLYLNAYLISRHHSNLGDWNSFSMFSEEFMKAFEFLKKTSPLCLINEIKFNSDKMQMDIRNNNKFQRNQKDAQNSSISLYTYARLLYSTLVASDYYGTSEFMNEIETKEFGEIDKIDSFYDIYKKSTIYQHNINYKKGKRNKDKPINDLRNQAFWDTEEMLLNHLEENIYFLKAPTGIGKSNIALNLSLQLAQQKSDIRKIYYVYPFNTLVEQTRSSLKEVFGEDEELYSNIVTINSITPIKRSGINKVNQQEPGQKEDNNEDFYVKDLLNRQFLNYPFILTTSVSLFQTMFGDKQSDVFAFHQLMNSVIVLDEIQSYKNTIWAEIIQFLQMYSKILNIKIIIMSATLPSLDLFLENEKVQNLLIQPERYFNHPLFSGRVGCDYSLLDQEFAEEKLIDSILKYVKENKRILIEFIKKKTASKYYYLIKELVMENDIAIPVEFISGDDNEIERGRIIKKVKECSDNKTGIVLISTQVIEAGVDIDMEIGFKDISKLDSEEQFMGRINRSCNNNEAGTVHFFDLDQVKSIYRQDVRADKELTLHQEEMRQILDSKDYDPYYAIVIQRLKEYKSWNDKNNLEEFYKSSVLNLDFPKVAERLRLIDEDQNQISVFLAREIVLEEDGDKKIIDGEKIWKDYKSLLQNQTMDYSKKIIELSNIMSKMNYFIYQIRANALPPYGDKVGEIYAIFEGEQYFEDGKLNREVLEGGGIFGE